MRAIEVELKSYIPEFRNFSIELFQKLGCSTQAITETKVRVLAPSEEIAAMVEKYIFFNL